MTYEIDRCYDFTINREHSTDTEFAINVDTDTGDATVMLPKLEFQRRPDYLTPSKLYCRVKSIGDTGLPKLTHVIAPYVEQLYQSIYQRGDSFECEVMTVPPNPAEEDFQLRDRNGIFIRLHEPEGLLTRGQIVRCKFTKLTSNYFQIIRVDDGAKMPYYSPETIFDAIGTPAGIRKLVYRILLRNHFNTILKDIADKHPRWLFNGAREIIRRLPEIFIRSNLKRNSQSACMLMDVLRNSLLYLLEDSGFLNAVPSEERRSLQMTLTDMVDSLEPYRQTLHIISTDGQDSFADRLLDKLQKSGYLYHPADQFRILMLIFRLQPDKVGHYLPRIFESIFGRELDNWKREPFRSAFVEQFDIYVRQARREIDNLPLAESREQKSRLENILTAIALQMILADEQLHRTASLFYRYISLLRPLNSQALLSKSFLSLMGVDVASRLNYNDLKEPMMMMTRATVMPAGDFMERLDKTHRLITDNVELVISSKGISLSQVGRRDITERVVPEGLMPWLRPQIFLNGIKGMTGAKLRKLPDHQQWWLDIETSLFESAPHADTPQKQDAREQPHRRAERGDDVYIVIDGVDDYFDNNPTFRCRIMDEEFDEGTGILKRDQIVGYNLKQPSETAYRSSDGSRLGYYAKVLEERPDGTYVFSLRDEVIRFIDEEFNYDSEYTAIIAGINEHDYSAISREGVGLFLEREGKDEKPYNIGDIVRIRIRTIGKQGQLRGYILERLDDESEKFDKMKAFDGLMHTLGETGEYETTEKEDDEQLMRDIDEILTPGEVRELIEIIRFKAINDSDLIKAYDYLRFGRLLALMLGDTGLADKLGTHAALLTLHQYYATNSRIDPDKLEALQPQAAGDPLLKMIYHRLEMVSWLERPDRAAELFATASDPSNELEGSIARMVLSYNMLRASSSTDDDSIASEIKSRIMEKLNVNNEMRPGKYYGSESKYLEFKTSIVFPAVAPGQEMREDHRAQLFHILSRITGFLNADGGRLYLGVNNDGYEVGMHDDMKFFASRTMTVGHVGMKIRDTDRLCVYLENIINENFEPTVARKITVSKDEEATKEVIVIDIARSLSPVYIDGRLFVRQSGQSTREYHGKDIADFVAEREALSIESNHIQALANEKARTTVVPVETPAAKTAEPPAAPTATAADTARQGSVMDIIPTSAWRPNVQHEYEPGYTEAAAYLYLMPEGKIRYSQTDLYLEPGETCSQALVVPHELKDGFLILGFEGERVLRVPLPEIFQKGENILHAYNTDHILIFAAIASKDDGLITVGADSASSLWKRATRLSQIEAAHLTSQPRRIHEAPVHHTVAYEIADSSAMSHFADCIADKMTNKRFGTTMRVKESAPTMAERMSELVADCRPN